VFGTACCVLAALGYTIVNICLRQLTVRYDPAWLLWLKESMTVVWLVPWLVWQAARGRRPIPGGRVLGALMAVGLLTHLGGNLPLIWAMGVVGLAITIPLATGVNLVACAVLGRLVLRERVSPQSALAMSILIVSMVLLSAGAGRANDSMAVSDHVVNGPLWVALAVAASCLAGVVYGVLNIAIRRALTASVPVTALGFIIPAMGALSLAPVCLGRFGVAGLLTTAGSDLFLIAFCGTLNLLAYLAIIKGLQMTGVVRANVLSASQVAMAAVAGFLFFQEAAGPALVAGVAMTIAGMVMIGRPS
jgi:drug/metabolite transporter (DMT)-like permease